MNRVYNKSLTFSEHLYYYGPLSDGLREDIPSTDELFKMGSDKIKKSSYLWLSGVGTRPSMHWDSDHNLFVHLYGRKRFVFFPPWQSHNLYPFPRLHPSWHKAQVFSDSQKWDSLRHPNFQYAGAIVAELEPGDILYSPPYYWHQPISITPCVSIASWSQTPTWNEFLEEVYYATEMAFESKTLSLQEKKYALIKHFDGVFEKLYGKENKHKIFSIIVETRWKTLKEAFKDQKDICEFSEETKKKIEGMEWGKKIKQGADVVVETWGKKLFPGINKELNYWKAARDLEMFDYVERMIKRVVGAGHTFAFLKNCDLKK